VRHGVPPAMTLPNFFLIGPARCGTDSLTYYLRQHPDIYMAPMKETNWFVSMGRPCTYCGPGDQEQLSRLWLPSADAYQKQFEAASSERAIGEASPWYIYFPEVAERIYKAVPDARIVAVLRQPVARAFSSFGLLRKTLREPEVDFGRAVDLEPSRIE